MGLGGQAFVDWVDRPLWTGWTGLYGLGGQPSGLGAFPLPFLVLSTKSASVMCQWPIVAGLLSFSVHRPSPLRALTWKVCRPLAEPLAPFWPGSTAQQEQGDDQHQHCQHFEPSLFRKTMILPTSSPCPP